MPGNHWIFAATNMLIMKRTHLFITLLMAFFTTEIFAQQSQSDTLLLNDLTSFRPQAGNWQIVGDVLIDPRVDPTVHEKPSEPEKKKKKSKNDPIISHPSAIVFQPGKGILLNLNDDTKKDNLVTTWEHGDLELELEVMLPKGSNSGIFLQGRYEIQLFDSWGVREPKYSDMGGIYRNWETDPKKFYPGKPPISNSSKAPGLWQTLKISFRAPRFDGTGKKIANAKFVSVELNGVKIHDNVEVPLLTGSPIENNEKPLGPLMIQGDHGPVAIRNIRYKSMKDLAISISPFAYKTFHGRFKTIADFMSEKPLSTGTIPELTYEVVDTDNMYAAIFSGTVTVPEDNTYDFSLVYSGGARLIVNGQLVIDYQRADGSRDDRGSIPLKAGTYPIEIYNYKDVSWVAPRLALFIKTNNSYQKGFFAYNSNPPDDNPVAPILINPGNKTKLLRAFVDFNGAKSQRLTHTIGVGDPAGINYVYDLKTGNIACVWHGNFVDATPMWHDRGDGSFKPNGAPQFLFIGPSLAALSDPRDAFPVAANEGDFHSKGYVIEEATGRPIFKYGYKNLDITDKIFPDDSDRIITRQLTVKNAGSLSGLYCKLAEGAGIELISEGLYVIDKRLYVKVLEKGPVIRDSNGKKELILPVTAETISYSIIW